MIIYKNEMVEEGKEFNTDYWFPETTWPRSHLGSFPLGTSGDQMSFYFI